MNQKACYIRLTQPRDGRNRAMVRCRIDRPAKEIDQGSRPPLLDCSKEGVRQYFMSWVNFLGRYASSMPGVPQRSRAGIGNMKDAERFRCIRYIQSLQTYLPIDIAVFPKISLGVCQFELIEARVAAAKGRWLASQPLSIVKYNQCSYRMFFKSQIFLNSSENAFRGFGFSFPACPKNENFEFLISDSLYML